MSERRYRTVVIDPPWDYRRERGGFRMGRTVPRAERKEMDYALMTLAQIEALPVSDLAEPDAHLYLWTTQRYVEHSFGLVRAWGFEPRALLVWCKAPRGWAPGGTFMSTTEFAIFAVRGSLPALTRCERQWWQWQRGEHSAKPEAFLDVVEQVSPPQRLEMFARRNRIGWDTWGNEALEHVTLAAGVSGAD